MKRTKRGGGIFAAVGAATGLGNAFRFPALCLSYGGAFILAYAVCLALVCLPVLCAELNCGRAEGGAEKSKAWVYIARAAAVNSALVALYYAVIASKLGCACVGYALPPERDGRSSAINLIAIVLVLFICFLVLGGGSSALARSGKISVTLSLSLLFYLAVRGAIRGVNLPFDFAALAGGAIWTDALGQALLSLSLAAGVMPAFARNLEDDFSAVKTALKIISANFSGCVCAALATLPFVSQFPSGGAIDCAFAVYPQVVAAAGGRFFGFITFAVLTAVAVHSLCSLASPVVGLFDKKPRLAALAFCALAAALYPVFELGGGQALNACDRMACSVNAVIIAFAECVFFASRGHIRGLNRIICPICCGALALFSLCSARFSHFAPPCIACAYAAFFAVALSPLTAVGLRDKIRVWKNYLTSRRRSNAAGSRFCLRKTGRARRNKPQRLSATQAPVSAVRSRWSGSGCTKG